MNEGGVKSPTQITPNNLCRHFPLKEVEPQTLPLECELRFVTRFRGYSVGRTVGERYSTVQKPGRHLDRHLVRYFVLCKLISDVFRNRFLVPANCVHIVSFTPELSIAILILQIGIDILEEVQNAV